MTTVRVITAFVVRDWYTTRSYRLDFVLEIAGLLFQLTLFYFIGSLIDSANPALASGLDDSYFAFVIIGLALLNLLSTALVSFSATLRTEQTTGSLEALLVTPQSSTLLIMGSASYAFMRALMQMVLFVGLGVLFFGLRLTDEFWPLLASGFALAASIALFGSLGIMVAAATLVFKRVSSLLGLITSFIALFGGVYFPISLLPDPIQILANAVPFTWALTVLRGALLEGAVDVSRLLILGIVATTLMPLSLWVMRKAVDRARSDASLVQF